MQDYIAMLNSSKPLFIFFVGLLSLVIGSFLNVVISRLPRLLQRDWRKQCYEFLETKIPVSEQPDLMQNTNALWGMFWPRSHCPQCKTMIKAYDNIPILSYLILRGKCRACHKHISLQYPIVEGITAFLCILVAWNFGVTWQTLAGCILTYVLIVQSCIDLEHKIIPDEITLPLLWLGLLLNIFDVFVTTQDAIIGAIIGYLALWIIYWVFYWVTGKEGMGYGDFKLLAMLGAWFGWQMLPFIILCSSIVGAVIGVGLLLSTHKGRNTRIPFGPFLAIAGWLAMLYGPAINAWYLSSSGFLL